MKPKHAKKVINRPLQTLALSTVISVGAFGVACVPVSAFAAPVFSASANAFSISKLENGKFKITLDLADSQRGKTILVKNSVSLNGKTTLVTLGKFKAGARGKGTLTVSKKIAVGSALLVSSGAKLLIQRRITAIRNVLAIAPAPAVPTTPIVTYPPISAAPATPVDPAIARAALRTAILNAAASKADYLLAGGLAEDSVYTNVTSAVSAESQVTATIVASTGTLIQATDTLYGSVDAADSALVDAVFALQAFPILGGSVLETVYLELEEVLNTPTPVTATLVAKTSAVNAAITAMVADETALSAALTNAHVATEAYRKTGASQTAPVYTDAVDAFLSNTPVVETLVATTTLLEAATPEAIASQAAAIEADTNGNVALSAHSRVVGWNEDPLRNALVEAMVTLPFDLELVAEATAALNADVQAKINSMPAVSAARLDALVAKEFFLRIGGSQDDAAYQDVDTYVDATWFDLNLMVSANAALNAESARLGEIESAYFAALAEAAAVQYVYAQAGGDTSSIDYTDLTDMRTLFYQYTAETVPITASLITLSQALRDSLPSLYVTAGLTADEITLLEAIGDAQGAVYPHAFAGGTSNDLEFIELFDALVVDPQVLATIVAKTNALNAATVTLNAAKTLGHQARAALGGAVSAYLSAGGYFLDDLVIAADLLMQDPAALVADITAATDAMNSAVALKASGYAALQVALSNATRALIGYSWVGGQYLDDASLAVDAALTDLSPNLEILTSTTAALNAEIDVLVAYRTAFSEADALASAASFAYFYNGGDYNDQVHQDLLTELWGAQPVVATIITLTAALNDAAQALLEANTAVEEGVPAAHSALTAYSLAGGQIADAVFTGLQAALNQDPYVVLDIQDGLIAINEATLALNTAKQSYRDAVIGAAVAMQSHTLAGGLAADTAYAALQALIDANEQVTATIVAAIATLEAATLALP